MISININVSALGPVVIVLGLSIGIGIVVSILDFFLQIVLGITTAAAGSAGSADKPNKSVLLCFIAISLAACVGAVSLSLQGYQLLAYILAIAGGIALPVAIGARVKRSN